eukprot:TRINITY_DN9038_c1_g1_i1.p1 TRINITY_DN9038_c1_g1~~TRINITY_DN9038_c1_g1_i1.p1  ORF type:complete len:536 (+),score=179.59 TRINITY_DN9038_c1_g1_i1:194-1801(+)
MFRELVLLQDAIVSITMVEASMASSSILGGQSVVRTNFPTNPMVQYREEEEVILKSVGLSELIPVYNDQEGTLDEISPDQPEDEYISQKFELLREKVAEQERKLKEKEERSKLSQLERQQEEKEQRQKIEISKKLQAERASKLVNMIKSNAIEKKNRSSQDLSQTDDKSKINISQQTTQQKKQEQEREHHQHMPHKKSSHQTTLDSTQEPQKIDKSLPPTQRRPKLLQQRPTTQSSQQIAHKSHNNPLEEPQSQRQAQTQAQTQQQAQPQPQPRPQTQSRPRPQPQPHPRPQPQPQPQPQLEPQPQPQPQPPQTKNWNFPQVNAQDTDHPSMTASLSQILLKTDNSQGNSNSNMDIDVDQVMRDIGIVPEEFSSSEPAKEITQEKKEIDWEHEILVKPIDFGRGIICESVGGEGDGGRDKDISARHEAGVDCVVKVKVSPKKRMRDEVQDFQSNKERKIATTSSGATNPTTRIPTVTPIIPTNTTTNQVIATTKTNPITLTPANIHKDDGVDDIDFDWINEDELAGDCTPVNRFF